jgi:hypothetical protein
MSRQVILNLESPLYESRTKLVGGLPCKCREHNLLWHQAIHENMSERSQYENSCFSGPWSGNDHQRNSWVAENARVLLRIWRMNLKPWHGGNDNLNEIVERYHVTTLRYFYSTAMDLTAAA